MRHIPASLTVCALSVVASAIAAAPAFAAGFNGTIEMNITNDKMGGGSQKLSLGDGGLLSDLSIQSPRGQMQMKTLIKHSDPNNAYLINDAEKSYAVVAIPPPQAQQDNGETWTVKKVGTDKIAGFNTVHVTATSSTGKSLDLWTAKDIMNADDFAKAQGPGKIPSGLVKALKDAGADGFFAKMVQKGPDGSTTTMEVTKVTKGSLPASTFDVPAGYTKQAAPGPGALPPEVQKQLEEKMKNMTPEQREQLQKAMQGHGMPPSAPPGH